MFIISEGIDKILKRMKNKIKRIIRYIIQQNYNEILVAGWIGSGSTYIYNVLKDMGAIVTKIHGKPMIDFKGKVFFTIRDPRDIVISTAKRKFQDIWKTGNQKKAIILSIDHFCKYHENGKDLIESMKMKNVQIIRYEDFFLGNELLLLKYLYLQLPNPDEDINYNTILKKNSMESNLKRISKLGGEFKTFDKKTHLHGKHISNKGKIGIYKEFFERDIIKYFNSKFDNAYIRNLYKMNE